MKRSNTAFTLTELLVAIAIIAVLLALVLGNVGKLFNLSLRTQSANNLRQIYITFQGYAQENSNRWPAVTSSSKPNGQWPFDLAPYASLSPPTQPGSDPTHIFLGTIFESPAAKDDLSDRLDTLPSNRLRYGYGMNKDLPSVGGGQFPKSPKSAMLIQHPQRAVLLLENDNAIAGASRHNAITAVRGRYQDVINVVFADGHVESLPVNTIPSKQTSDEGRLFWRGASQ